MRINEKKLQIIKNYFYEILPHIRFKENKEDLEFECVLKLGDTSMFRTYHIEQYFPCNIISNVTFTVFLENISIPSIYDGFKTIRNITLHANRFK
jgi:hypothetical protein